MLQNYYEDYLFLSLMV